MNMHGPWHLTIDCISVLHVLTLAGIEFVIVELEIELNAHENSW